MQYVATVTCLYTARTPDKILDTGNCLVGRPNSMEWQGIAKPTANSDSDVLRRALDLFGHSTTAMYMMRDAKTPQGTLVTYCGTCRLRNPIKVATQ